MQLRLVSNHPYLIEEAEPHTYTEEMLIKASGKLEVLSRMLEMNNISDDVSLLGTKRTQTKRGQKDKERSRKIKERSSLFK